jgi:hypothetical protein
MSEIGSIYLDSDFISNLNALDNDKLSGLIALVLDIYDEDMNNEKLTYITKVIDNLNGQDDGIDFFRKVRYLVKKASYYRLSKKYKIELLQLSLSEDKAELIIETVKMYLDKLDEVNKKGSKPEIFIKDFELKTEMPIYNSTIHHHDDIKKQNVILKLDIEGKKQPNHLILAMDKVKLVSLYKEVERIQEKLDKLY